VRNQDIRALLSPREPFKAFLLYTRAYARDYILGAFVGLVFILVDLTMPLVMREVVSRFESGEISWRFLGGSFAVFMLIPTISGIARYIQRMLIIRASRKFEYDLRNDYFHHIQELSQDFFHSVSTGDIMARATNDLNFVRAFAGPGVMNSLNMIRLPLTLSAMFYLSAKLTFISLIPLPFVCLIVYLFVMYMHKQTKIVQKQFSVLTGRAQENIAGGRVVRSYGIADREIRDFTKESTKYMREGLKLSIAMSMAWPIIGIIVGAVSLLVIWAGGGMVIDGKMSIADLAGFIFYLVMLTWPIAEFGWVLTLYQRGAVSMTRIIEFMCREPEVKDDGNTDTTIRDFTGAISFQNVSFAYDKQIILDGLSFNVPAGKTVAIVGPTGSGKSTIVSLLIREYDPEHGTISIDGHDLKTIPLKTLRRNIGAVPQDTFLFSDTIANNLTLGLTDIDTQTMDSACEAAQFTQSLADMPDGYGTLLGERGINLSGGQKQRLAIARALVRNPRILILDDALSNVDTHTEEQILQRLKEIMRERTSVIISHRISTVNHADNILVLSDGQIVEEGTHDELVALDGLYADMYRRQLLEEEIEET